MKGEWGTAEVFILHTHTHTKSNAGQFQANKSEKSFSYIFMHLTPLSSDRPQVTNLKCP